MTAPAWEERPLWIGPVTSGTEIIDTRVTSFQERKFLDIIRQRTDFSCGAAAVATIFSYGYGRRTNETQILVNMLRVADPVVVRQRGFSLLDIKRYVEAIGMRGEGYQVPFESLYELRVPVIVLLDTRGYKHFVVLRKARDGYVQIADPALGNRILWREDFEAGWNGIVFAILAEPYDQNNILANPPEPLSARRLYALNSPVFNAEIYDFGIGPATQFSF
jgi:predicted double-glycine peptidase